MKCPKCESYNIKKDGSRILKGIKTPIAKCNECGYKGNINDFGGPDIIKIVDPIKREIWNARISASKMGQGKGKIIPEETKQKISDSLKGIPKSEETKKKMSIGHIGKSPGNKGMIYSEETKENMKRK